MLTQNEKKVLRLIFLGAKLSINQLAKESGLSPNGAYKMLKKFHEEGILRHEEIANSKIYSLDYQNEKTANVLKLALIEDSLSKKLQSRQEDLKPLRQSSKACILFGSYIKNEKPNDMDMLFVIEKDKYPEHKKASKKIYETMPAKAHEVLQTEEDFRGNLQKKDPVVMEALKKGIILWGQDTIIELVKSAAK